jgi:hypothetical protein
MGEHRLCSGTDPSRTITAVWNVINSGRWNHPRYVVVTNNWVRVTPPLRHTRSRNTLETRWVRNSARTFLWQRGDLVPTCRNPGSRLFPPANLSLSLSLSLSLFWLVFPRACLHAELQRWMELVPQDRQIFCPLLPLDFMDTVFTPHITLRNICAVFSEYCLSIIDPASMWGHSCAVSVCAVWSKLPTTAFLVILC